MSGKQQKNALLLRTFATSTMRYPPLFFTQAQNVPFPPLFFTKAQNVPFPPKYPRIKLSLRGA